MATCGQNYLKQCSAAIALLTVGLVGAPAHAQTTPQFSIFENLTLTPNFTPNPATVRGISGGPRPAAEIAGRPDTATGACVGYVDEQPDHTMQLTQFFNYLSL